MKNPTQLRIVKRDGLFVVQIRKQRFWTRRWWWQDIWRHLDNVAARGVTEVFSKEKAEASCHEYLRQERAKNKPDIEVKTYNTGLNDIHWPGPPEMPECKPPKVAKDE